MIRVSMSNLLLFFGIIFQISYGFELKTFRCYNGDYILNRRVCDGWSNCNEREDERDCNHRRCSTEEFTCNLGFGHSQCINSMARCNTKKDCEDGTDELNCGDEINVKNCTSKEKFLCNDGLRCLDVEYTCDGSCNCFDCSDENDNCSKIDNALMKKCPNAYFVTANGPQCLCDSIVDQNSTTCNNIRSCDSGSSCEQNCIQYKIKKQCTCYKGYQVIKNEKNREISCRNEYWHRNLILYATRFKIKSLNVTSTKASTVQNGIQNCTALFAANDYIYYATLLPDNRGSIFKASLGIGKSQTIIQTDFPVTSVAVDYITNNIYFTSNGSLIVCENHGKICIKLKCCGINYVAVAPKSGLMFYLQPQLMHLQNLVLVMKSNMDGSNETIFADDVYKGNISIVIDELQEKLYLLELNDGVKIDGISFDGDTKETITPQNVRRFSVYNGDVFFTKDQGNDIFYVKKITNTKFETDDKNLYFHDSSASSMKFVHVYNDVLQRFDQNPCAKTSCSDLCLIKPAAGPSSVLSYVCLRNNFTSTNYNRSISSHPDPVIPAQAVHDDASKVIIFFPVFVILGILGGTGYLLFLKWNWCEYYLTLRRWQQSKRDQGIDMNSQDE